MNEREKILGRIREGLQVAAPLPGHEHTGDPPHQRAASATEARQWLPKVGASFDERLALFGKHATELKAAFSLVNSPEELRAVLLALRDTEGWKKVGSHSGKLTDPACQTLGLPVCRTDQA